MEPRQDLHSYNREGTPILKFNSFRARRYLRTRFVEGAFLLASEATDLELELIDFSRGLVKQSLGNIAVGNAWKVERINQFNFIVKPGEAWYKGLPFNLRSSSDHLVSGLNLSLGNAPLNTIISEVPDGKKITINSATATKKYRVVITAREQAVTSQDDAFLKNANLSESTGQKIRLQYLINIVDDSLQTTAPVPYTGDDSTDQNLVDEIVVNVGGSGSAGSLISTNAITGSEHIDGRDIEITVVNASGVNPLPKTLGDQTGFFGGKLIDNVGNEYHIVSMFSDPTDSSGKEIIRLDKEDDQSNPIIGLAASYRLVKKDVYVTDDINGSPSGKLFWPIATLDWVTATGLTHDTKVVDLRTTIKDQGEFQYLINEKIDLIPSGGGDVDFADTVSDTVTWTQDISLVNAYGPSQTVSAGSQVMVEEGTLVYELDLATAAVIDRGTDNLTINSIALPNVTMAGGDDLSDIRVGNIITDSAGNIAEVESINNISKVIKVIGTLAATGACTVSLDSFAPGKAPLTLNSYVLAARYGNKVYFGKGALELEIGEVSQLGDGVPQALLTYLGATDENDATPNYSSVITITQGAPLNQTISELDIAVGGILDALAEPIYDERLLFPAGLTAGTNVILPNNSRDSGNPQYYVAAEGLLEIYQNSLYKFQTVDWNTVDNQTIVFTSDLPPDTEIHFRIDSISGGTGAVGSLAITTSTADPSLTEYPGNQDHGIHKNTTSGDVFLSYNDSGTIKKVQLT